MSARTEDLEIPCKGSRVRGKPMPTLANVKRRLSVSDRTYVVSEECGPSRDLSSHPLERNRPGNILSQGFALLSDKSLSVPIRRNGPDSPENDTPMATPGTAFMVTDTPQRRKRAEGDDEETSQDSETASTQSVSSLSSSSRSSRTASPLVANSPEFKKSKYSARSTSKPKSWAVVSTAAFSTCSETGETSMTTAADEEGISAQRLKNPRLLADIRRPLSSMESRETTANNLERRYGSRAVPGSKKHSTQASASLKRELVTSYVDESPGNSVAKLSRQKSPCSNDSDVAVKVLKKLTPKRKRISEKASPERVSTTAAAGNSDVVTTARLQSKEKCSLTPSFCIPHSSAEVPLERRSVVSSLSLNSVATEKQEVDVAEKGKEMFYVTDAGDPFDAAEPLKRSEQPRNSWGKPETIMRSSYRSKTWKYSGVDDLRPGDSNIAQMEGTEDDVIRVEKEILQLKECLLYPLSVCLLMGFILVGTFLLLPIDPSHRLEIKGLTSTDCASSSCLRDASYLNTLLSWDRVDPCVDFYAFVCDRWTSQYTASKPTSFPETFDDDYAALLENKIHSMINNESLESHSLRPIRQLYEKCVSVARTDEEGWDPILELMFDVSLEGFPLTPPVRSSKSVWEMAAKVLRRTGSSAIFGVGVAAYPLKDVGRDFLSVELPEMLTGSDDVDINEATRLYTEAVFCALRVLKKEYLPPIHALSVVKFACDLEKLVRRIVLAGGGRPVVEVLNASSELLSFFTELLRGVENVPFSGTGSVVVLQFPSAVRDTVNLVRETEVHTVMNYLGIRLIAETSPFLPRTEMVDFESTLLYGRRKADVPRPQLCVRMIEKALSPLILVSVLSELPIGASPALFSNITRELFKGILHQISTSSYFDTDSQDAIQTLMSTVELRVLRPNWINDPTLLERYIDGFSSSANRSGLQYYVESHEHTFMASVGRSSLQRWMRPVFTTNCWIELAPPAIYVPLLAFNIIPTYGVGVDEQQLSRLGRRLAECVLHLIFDYTFAMTNDRQRWLSEHSEKRLLGAEICINASAGEPPFRKVRDIMTVHYAYALFRERSKRKEAQILRLGGDRVLSWRQLFFVKLMLEACETSAHLGRTRSKAGQKWTTALRNGDDFADAYDCRLGSPMNAHKKCAL
ncbi:hypothetical protein HPB52_018140 [Rhipicephalus sanguineus]|uniref:Peptidase M13 N-terminal domain-containing protein n=1 Tax=Rhipicephalus sanguineus TaxID=34632 RepID=A0A9D4SZK3_RHISA|nr:hypothetical protein HPB52_018140 [Rhipicephalus sanguineus]